MTSAKKQSPSAGRHNQMAHQKYRIICALSFIFCCTIQAGAAIPSVPEQQVRHSINSLYKARTTIIDKHLELGVNQPLTATEENDFLLFLSYLDGRILYYCEQLSAYDGSESLKGTPCPVTADGNLETSSYSPLPPDRNKTDREMTAALDQELQTSFGTFDEMLLKEEEQIGAHVAKQREGNYPDDSRSAGKKEGAYSGDKNGTGKQPNSDGKAGMGKKSTPGSTTTGRDQTAKQGSNNGGAGAGSNRQSRLPPTAGNKDLSQNDDDIVAKQLREAAEQETDPEVKARLWEEYRKYKEGVD